MKIIDLTDTKKKLEEAEESDETDESEDEELQTFSEGDFVEHESQGEGLVAAKLTTETKWFTDPEDDDSEVTLEGDDDSPIYIVALMSGGSIPAEESELSPIDGLSGEGKEPDLEEDADDADLSAVYDDMDDLDDYDELLSVKTNIIHQTQASSLAYYLEGNDMTLEELSNLSYEELLNIPGVDDPEVGFASLPNGWSRKSVLEAWSTVGGTWRSCNARMVRHFGPRMAKRWCSALKDEVLGTERWRNRF